MPSQDEPLFPLLDRACAHWLHARYGPYSPGARAALYRLAAELFEALVELLRERATEEERMTRAAEMVQRYYL